MDQSIHLCFFSQDSALAEVIGRASGSGFASRACDEFELSRLNEHRDWCDVVLLDLRYSGTQGNSEAGLRLMDEISKVPLHPPVVALCDAENRSLLVGVMEHGAYDSVTNPPNMVELRLILKRACKFHTAEKEIDGLRSNTRGAGRLHELLGTSSSMQELFALAQKIAPCDVNVLITGETGTGKELLARAIHQMSGRATRPLVAFSCANLPETLIEDELFGHEKGAFTGAVMSRRGRIESADQGTLFLDEIGDLSLGLQPKLLRVLQERSFERLGSNAKVSVNIRLICATNRKLPEMVQQGKFREDLFYRLNVVQMHLPPLRERRDDISLLAQHFLQTSSEQFNKNVRELENPVQRAVVLSEGQTVDVWHLPGGIRSSPSEPVLIRSYEEEVRQFKRRLLLRTLQECGWRKAESARTLGVARGYLHRLINQLELRQTEDEVLALPSPEAILSGKQEL